MNAAIRYLSNLARQSWEGWNEFWFAPSDPATIGFVRLAAGLMIFYTHLVWSLDLEGFFGRDAWVSREAMTAFLDGDRPAYRPTDPWKAAKGMDYQGRAPFNLEGDPAGAGAPAGGEPLRPSPAATGPAAPRPDAGVNNPNILAGRPLFRPARGPQPLEALLGGRDRSATGIAAPAATGDAKPAAAAKASTEKPAPADTAEAVPAVVRAATDDLAPPPIAPAAKRSIWKPSHFWLVDGSPWLLWSSHVAALAVFLMFALGLFSRVTSVLTWMLVVSYAHRTPGALFGLDQINAMLAFYLMFAPTGAALSLDLWLRARREGAWPAVEKFTAATVSTRLIQLHMCLIYFMAGAGKMLGEAWWDGNAMWMAFANGEYQSVDMTWTRNFPVMLAIIGHCTILWEMGFGILVWNRSLRPLILAFAVPLHLGIGMCLGMMTFGLVMLIGVGSFIPPEVARAWLSGQWAPEEEDPERAELRRLAEAEAAAEAASNGEAGADSVPASRGLDRRRGRRTDLPAPRRR